MGLFSSITTYLKTKSTFTDVFANRFWPGKAPENAEMPYMTYQQVDGDSIYHAGGVSELASDFFQFDIWAESSESLDAAVTALYNVIDGFTGAMGSETIQGTFQTRKQLTTEERKDGSEIRDHTASIDYKFWYGRTAPTG